MVWLSWPPLVPLDLKYSCLKLSPTERFPLLNECYCYWLAGINYVSQFMSLFLKLKCDLHSQIAMKYYNVL